MDPIIARHLPLITNRIPFTFNPPSPLPPLTNRKEFLDTREQSAPPPSVIPNNVPLLKYSGSVVFTLQKEKETEKADKGKGAEEETADEEVEEVIESSILIPKPSEVIEGSILIPKPSGEPGRPRCGGYSLDEVLSPWGVETLAKVTVSIYFRCDSSYQDRYVSRPSLKMLQTKTSTPPSVI